MTLSRFNLGFIANFFPTSLTFALFLFVTHTPILHAASSYDYIACAIPSAGVTMITDLNNKSASWILDSDVDAADTEKVTIKSMQDPEYPEFDTYIITSATRKVQLRFLDGDKVGAGAYKANSDSKIIRLQNCSRDQD